MNTNFITTSFQTIVPLHYDIVYYMESTDNEELNNAMRQLQQAGSLFMNTEMLPFPIKLQYVSQRELDGDYLRSRLGEPYDTEDVNEVVDNMRECFSADKGGGLTARCLPSFTRDDVMEDDYAVCYCSDFGLLSAEEAFEKAKSFARYVAEENFKRLTNVSYDTYQRAKEDAQYPRRSSYGSRMMGLIVILPNPKKITSDMHKRITSLDKTIKELIGNGVGSEDELLAAYFKKKINKGKQKKVCPIYIKNNEIFLEISKNKSKEVKFERGHVPKSIYIFYLQQIQLHSINLTIPQYVSQLELEKYKDVLLLIYQNISGDGSKSETDIMSWWDKGVNTFLPAVTAINNFFKKEFDVETLKEEYNKSYLLEKNKDVVDDKYNPKYGITLGINDINLDSYSVNNKPYRDLYRKILNESFAN